MRVRFVQTDKRSAVEAFSLIEVGVAAFILAIVMAGLMFGYVQANRLAEWSSMSLAAQSYASQGVEQLRAGDWRPRDVSTNKGPNSAWEIYPGYKKTNIGILDIPIKGNPDSTNFGFFVTNIVTVTQISTNPPFLLQISSVASWKFYLTGQAYSNTVILQRAPDQ